MTPPDSIAAALLSHAEGSRCLAAAAELLIAQDWLGRDDFADRFVTVCLNPGSGKPMALIDWPAAIRALDTSLPSSGGRSGCSGSPRAWPTASPSTSATRSPGSTTATFSY